MSQNVFVTGTSSGFGRLTALSLARRGHQVFATMRDTATRNREAAEELRRIAEAEGLKIQVIEMSVTDDASVNAAVNGALASAGHLDAVVNNAGYGSAGIAETMTSAQFLAQLDANVAGPHRVARAVLPSMRARGKGLLVGVSSTISRITMPLMAPYCAGKAALETLFEGYRMELKPTGVESTLVQPGAFGTNLAARMVIGADADRAAGYGPLANGLQQMAEATVQMTTGPGAPSPQLVADAIVALIESPAGTRPAHVVVDRAAGANAEAINKAHAEETKKALSAFGMGMLCD